MQLSHPREWRDFTLQQSNQARGWRFCRFVLGFSVHVAPVLFLDLVTRWELAT
ncbi:hypothetical protein BJX70DRAFT_352401 [Aspergillus crustosus]